MSVHLMVMCLLEFGFSLVQVNVEEMKQELISWGTWKYRANWLEIQPQLLDSKKNYGLMVL